VGLLTGGEGQGLSKPGNMQKRLPTHAAQAQIEQLWQELAHDPAQQALACAALCQEQAPHLAEWLKAKILAGLSDR
jgi:hypothetical protein